MKREYLIMFLLLVICLTGINQIYAANADNQSLTDNCLNENPISSDIEDFELSDDSTSKLYMNEGDSDDYLTADNEPVVSGTSKTDTELSTNNSQRIYYQDEIDYCIKLTDANKNPLNNQKLSFEISNSTFTKAFTGITDETGNAVFKIPLNVGTFAVKGSYEGNADYNPSVLNGKLTVLSTIQSSDLNVYTFKREPFAITVFKSSGEYSDNTKVSFTIGGKTYDTVTDYFGKAELNINLDPGTYTIRTTANGMTVENKIEVINKAYTINRRNFYMYFARDGVLKEEYANAVLKFDGNFDGFGVITINSPAYIKGNNAKFINTVFHLNSNDITVDGITIQLTDSFEENEYAGILIDADDVTVSNVFMNITASDKKALGIFSYGDEETLNNIKLINNTIVFNAAGNGSYYWGVALTYTDNAIISGNNITCSMPLRSVNWDGGFYGGISSDSVAGVAIQSSRNLKFQNNHVKISGNSNQAGYPTLDAVLIHSCDNAVIFNNTILEEDFYTPNGTDNYLYALDVYLSNNVSILSNQIHLNTTGGKLAAGTAYGIQVSGPFADVVIAYNNISTINNGPNIGIYSQNYAGDTSLYIFSNTINVTGLAGEHNWALVAGIEVQDTNDTIWNNTIEVHNVANSTTGNAYGISYSQGTFRNHTYNIQYNKVKTDSDYAVYVNSSGKIKNTTVSNNVLVTKNHEGDDAVYVAGEGNYVGGNTGGGSVNMQEVPQWLAKLLRLNNALNSPGAGHSNNNGTGTGIIDNGGNQGIGNSSGTGILPNGGNANSNQTSNSYNHDANQIANSDAPHTANVRDSHGSERQNPTPGLSGNPIAGQPSSDAGSAPSQNDDVKAYEIEKSIIDEKTDNVLAILIVIVAILLLVIGYKRQSDKK